MFIITITLSSTPHQITLAYNTQESATNARSDIALKGLTEIRDDFGTVAEFLGDEVASVVVSNVRMKLTGENARGLLQLKADNDFQAELHQDPTMKFLVGLKNPIFDKG